MSAKKASTESFLRNYALQYPLLKELVRKAASIVESVLQNSGFEIHQVAFRAKTPSSVRRKIKRKKYTRPQAQLTDKLGVRVITYYGPDVYEVVQKLREEFRPNEPLCNDKLSFLGTREFGLRTVTLVVQLKEPRFNAAEYADLKGVWFEIQVRSLLEHAWAEIEHKVVYKSGVQYPTEFKRRFHSLAATLEMLDREFNEMRIHKDRLVDEYKQRYASRRGLEDPLDTARIIALFENLLPNGIGWRQAAEKGSAFPSQIEGSIVDAFQAAGVTNGTRLLRAFRSSSYRQAVRKFAANAGISPQEISHLAASILLVGTKRRSVLRDYLEEFSLDPNIAEALHERR